MMAITGYKCSGKYKIDNIMILEADSRSQQQVCFQPTPAEKISQAMSLLELA